MVAPWADAPRGRVASRPVAQVLPFRALRYAKDAGALADLVAPPYDVISPAERETYLRASPYNAVHLILPEVGYEEVGALIARWRGGGRARPRARRRC